MQTNSNESLPHNLHFFIPLLDEEFDDLAVMNAAPQIPDVPRPPREAASDWFE